MNTRATTAILVNQVVQKKCSLTALLSANKKKSIADSRALLRHVTLVL